jgi:UDP-glucose 4-epimerase
MLLVPPEADDPLATVSTGEDDMPATRAFVAGGAGFIGSHLVEALLRHSNEQVVVYDNLSSGTRSRLQSVLDDERLQLVIGNIEAFDDLVRAMEGCDHLYLLASNPDISLAIADPAIDFWRGTFLTHNVLEAMRINRVPRITYTSGSGVYGDQGETEVDEDFAPLIPISTYGASKLASEAMIAAYAHMFDIDAVVFRFANVVGSRQTHGVTYDFVRRLFADPSELQILGDGSQSKSYVHVEDVVGAMMLLTETGWEGFEILNVGTGDHITVSEIADLVVERMGLEKIPYSYTGGDRGWKGDVPIVRFRSSKLASLGWRCAYSSREAIIASIDANIAEAKIEGVGAAPVND